MNENECTRRGCIFKVPKDIQNAPSCFLDRNKIGYRVVSSSTQEDGTRHLLRLKSTAFRSTTFDQAENVELQVRRINENIVRLTWHNLGVVKKEVPVPLQIDSITTHPKADSTAYEVSITNQSDVIVVRRDTGTKL